MVCVAVCVVCCGLIVFVLTRLPSGASVGDACVAARAFVRARVRDVLAGEPGVRVVDNGISVLFHPFFLLGRELRGAEVRVASHGKPCQP